ncbi:tautomerase family protein [Agrobacterium sp. BT-220-3]|nr:tautomerase family protein [Agrobacterium sp. BT-220-3]
MDTIYIYCIKYCQIETGDLRRIPQALEKKGKAMPWITIDLSEGRTVEQKQKTAKAVTDALVEHCGCTAETVSIVFNDVSADNWAFGGTLISQRGKNG